MELEGRELLFMLPISDQEVFYLVEEKVYRVIGGMLAQGFPILEFIGGRKHKDSLYTKLLSKPDTIAANIYDKLRFRIVTRSPDDIFPVVSYLLRHVFPFNYVIPGQSTNTLFHFRSYCEQHPHLRSLFTQLQMTTQIYFSLYFTMTGLHALHMIIGLGLMTVITWMAWKGRFSSEYYTPVEMSGLYWHFVDIVWIFLFPLLYLIDRAG